MSEETLEDIYQRLYKGLFLELDAVDNGVNIADATNYNISTDLSSRVGHLNLPWNAPTDIGLSQHIQFKKALPLAEAELFSILY